MAERKAVTEVTERRLLKVKPQSGINCAGLIGGCSLPEKGRGLYANEIIKIDVVENVFSVGKKTLMKIVFRGR